MLSASRREFLLQSTIDFLPVAYADNQYQKHVVSDLINRPVGLFRTHIQAIQFFFRVEPLCPHGARILFEPQQIQN